MTRKKPQQGTKSKKEELFPQHPPPIPSSKTQTLFLRSLKGGVRLIAFFAASLGFLTAYLSLIPKVTVVQSDPLNWADPFTTQFVISNDGPLGINRFEAKCGITYVKYKNGAVVKGGGSIVSADMFKPRLEVGEKGTVSCPLTQLFGGDIAGADISIRVTFRPDFTWAYPSRSYRFVTMTDSSGRLHWYPEPLPVTR